MEMSNHDIVKSYKEAKDKKEQIKILSQLNVCSTETIRKILIEEGIPFQSLPRQRKKEESVESRHDTKCENPIIKEALHHYLESKKKLLAVLKDEYEKNVEKVQKEIVEIKTLIVETEGTE